MKIHDYTTAGGKNLIMDYINGLEDAEKLALLDIRRRIRKDGLDALDVLNTRPLRGKLWEIKASQTRIMYVLVDGDKIYFLHICKKQKQKAEKTELEKAVKRGKEAGLL